MDLSAGTRMDETAQSELLGAAAGGAAPALARQLMLQAAGAEVEGDPLAAMLAVQMAAVHEAALRLLKRAGETGGDGADGTETQALCARQAARLLHLFQRQARTLERRRATAKLEAQAAAHARQKEEEARRRAPEPVLDEFDEDAFWEEFGADAPGADEAGTGGIGAGGIARGTAADRTAWAADRDPPARDAAAQAGIAETSDQLSAMFARHAAVTRAQARAAAGRTGAASDTAEGGGCGNGKGTGPAG